MKRELILSDIDLLKITKKDLLNYLKYKKIEFNYSIDENSMIFCDKKLDVNFLIKIKHTPKNIWNFIEMFSEYYNESYIDTYEKIIGIKHYPKDRGDKIDAICSWGEGPDDVMITCEYYGIFRYFDISKENAQRLGYELLDTAKQANELDESYGSYIEKENEKNK